MANIKSAIKRIKTNKRDNLKNKKAKNLIKNAIKAANDAIINKKDEALDLIKKAVIIIDKQTTKGIIHRNTAARKKSGLMKKIKTLIKT
jgi:small subunit ribosomal protein S20